MRREALTGHLTRRRDGEGRPPEVLYPPGNKSVFDGTDREDRLRMWGYLRNVSACPPWKSELFLNASKYYLIL